MVGNRIIEALKDKRLSVNKVADMIGMSQTTLNNQLRETSPLTIKTIEKILPHLEDVSMEWLIRNEGNMKKGFFNQMVGRLSSCGDGDIFQTVNESQDNDLKKQIQKLEAEKERLLGIIEKLTGK